MRACDVLVKIGGSILDHETVTAALVPCLTELARKCRIVVLTGGGQAAKRMKANQRTVNSDFHRCWKGGVYCLEVNASLLASYSPTFALVASLHDIEACFSAGKVAVIAPAGILENSLDLVPDWEVTTDSMGLYFATRLGAQRYVVVSDVQGIYEQRPAADSLQAPLQRLRIDELERLPTSKLDPSFPVYFRRFPLPTVVVSGKYPTRVSAAIRGDSTVGTEIER